MSDNDVDQLVAFLRAWSEDQMVIARDNHPSQSGWFRARSEALADAASEIEAGAFKEGVRGFLRLRAPGASKEASPE